VLADYSVGQGSVGLWLIGRPDEATAMATRTLELGATMEHAYSRAVALFYPAFAWCCLGDREAFRGAAVALFELCERHAMDMLTNEALLLRGRARWEAGDGGGIADMERALDTIDAGGDYAFAMFYAGLLVEALLAAGRIDEAERRLGRARAYAEHGQCFFASEIVRWTGEIHAQRGRADAAGRAFAEAGALALEHDAVALALRAGISAAAWTDGPLGADARVHLHALLNRIEGGARTADVVRARRLLGGRD